MIEGSSKDKEMRAAMGETLEAITALVFEARVQIDAGARTDVIILTLGILEELTATLFRVQMVKWRGRE